MNKAKELKYYAGIDLGGTFTKGGIIDSEGNLIIKSSIKTEKDYDTLTKSMADFVSALEKEANVTLSGIGIGIPCTVDSKRGVILYGNNLDLNTKPLTSDLSKMTNLPVHITNDANAAALGEYAFGAGKKYKNILFVTLGTGVGGGIIIDGNIYEGLDGSGGELGHMVIDMNGKMCTCGRRGCLEAYASASALVDDAKNYMRKHPNTVMQKLCNGDIEEMNGKLFFEAVKAEDQGAKEVYGKYTGYLASGLVSLANIFRPDAIIIGGGISAVGTLLTDPLNQILNHEIYGGNETAHVEILASQLANDAGLYGAAKLAME